MIPRAVGSRIGEPVKWNVDARISFKNMRDGELNSCIRYSLNIKGAEDLYDNFSEIDFLIVFDRGDKFLLDAFGAMKNIFPSYCLCVITLRV